MPVWIQIYLATMAVAKELLRYLREHRKCSHPEQLARLNQLKTQINLAANDKKDLNITV